MFDFFHACMLASLLACLLTSLLAYIVHACLQWDSPPDYIPHPRSLLRKGCKGMYHTSPPLLACFCACPYACPFHVGTTTSTTAPFKASCRPTFYRMWHGQSVDTLVHISLHMVTIPPPPWMSAAHAHGDKVGHPAVCFNGCPNQESADHYYFKGIIIGMCSHFGANSAT
jgi:hypothetical protein